MQEMKAPGSVRVMVCGTKFSPTCNAAVEVAIELAGRFSSRLLLVHVLEGLTPEAARQRLEAIAARAPDLISECLVARGEPGHAIARIAQHAHAELIVIGLGHHSEALVPNDIEDVLTRVGSCPVLTVAEDESPADVVKRLFGVGVVGQRCLVCSRPLGELICESCRARITGEVIERRHLMEQLATHGLG